MTGTRSNSVRAVLTVLAVVMAVFAGRHVIASGPAVPHTPSGTTVPTALSVVSDDHALAAVTSRAPIPVQDISLDLGMVAVAATFAAGAYWLVNAQTSGNLSFARRLGVRWRRRGPPKLATF